MEQVHAACAAEAMRVPVLASTMYSSCSPLLHSPCVPPANAHQQSCQCRAQQAHCTLSACLLHVSCMSLRVSCKQIIDGQQRLTTLVMLLGYLRAWAAEQQDLGSLAERVERMLHIPADPLNPAAKAR